MSSNLARRGIASLDLATLAQLPAELAQTLTAAYEHNPRLNAYTSLVSPQDALKNWEKAGDGSLRGFSMGIKDVFCTNDLPTTASSRMLQNYTSPFEATVVKRLKAAGAVMIGKTNLDEFGMGSANLNSHFGPTFNPHDQTRVAGGSSGGSASAVASGLCRIALASDTGGSTRLPAAFCGVVGMKPSYGLLSRWGMIAYASSLDCVGIMARNVSDVRSTLRVLSQHDELDPTSVSEESRSLARFQQKCFSSRTSLTDLTGLKVGVPIEYFLSELSPSVLPSFRRTLRSLQAMGATLSSVSIPSTPNALAAYYVIASAEASSNLARFDGLRFGTRSESDTKKHTEGERAALYSTTRSAGFGKEVQKRLLLGTHALSAEAFDNYFLQAQRVRKLLQQEFNDIFTLPSPLTQTLSSRTAEGVDIIIHPSSISTAPLVSATTPISSTSSYVQDVLNVPASLAGLPALSLPAGVSEEDGMPVAVQIAAQWGGDELLLMVGEALEIWEKEAGKNP